MFKVHDVALILIIRSALTFNIHDVALILVIRTCPHVHALHVLSKFIFKQQTLLSTVFSKQLHILFSKGCDVPLQAAGSLHIPVNAETLDRPSRLA